MRSLSRYTVKVYMPSSSTSISRFAMQRCTDSSGGKVEALQINGGGDSARGPGDLQLGGVVSLLRVDANAPVSGERPCWGMVWPRGRVPLTSTASRTPRMDAWPWLSTNSEQKTAYCRLGRTGCSIVVLLYHQRGGGRIYSSASARTSARCLGVRPVPCCTCCRQEMPEMTTSASRSRAATFGKSR